MAEMGAAIGAMKLGARDQELEVALGAERGVVGRRPEAGPARTAFVLFRTGELHLAAHRAVIGPVALFRVEGAAARRFGAFMKGDPVDIRRQVLAQGGDLVGGEAGHGRTPRQGSSSI